ncbi:hypothetical protein ACS13M_005286, partial [Escherichia coli]
MESFPPEKDRHTDGNVSKIHSMRAIAARKTFSPVRIFSVKSVSLIFLALCRIILFIRKRAARTVLT